MNMNTNEGMIAVVLSEYREGTVSYGLAYALLVIYGLSAYEARAKLGRTIH